MKTERRHELETNELADRLGHLIEQSRPYGRPLGLAALGLVTIGVVYWATTSYSQSRQREGWDQYFAAVSSQRDEQLSEVMTAFPGTTVATLARLQLADVQLRRGIDLLFTNRPAALDELKSAEENFVAVRSNAGSNKLLLERATFSLARTRESLNKLEEAKAEYESLVRDFPEGVYAGAAKARLADLQSAATQQFYTWFAQQDPRPAAETDLGSGDGRRFNFENLPDDSSGLLPSSGGLGDLDGPAANAGDDAGSSEGGPTLGGGAEATTNPPDANDASPAAEGTPAAPAATP